MPDFNIGKLGFGPAFTNFDKFFSDVESSAKQLQSLQPNYPPYNIRKNSENSYTIELAVAGFDETALEVTIDGGTLLVKGSSKKSESAEPANFLYRGIAARAFTKAFTVGDHIEVQNAELFNGMLKIALNRLVPDQAKPKNIPVICASKAQFLQEGAYDRVAEQL